MLSTDGSITRPDPTGASSTRNLPLSFTLQGIDIGHAAVRALGFRPETLTAFGVGYYAGKGIMRDTVVLPFHNAEGLLVAYAGYSPRDGAMRYPKRFDRRSELFNVYRAEHAGLFQDRLVVVTDLLSVLRLYELGLRRVVAIPADAVFEPQLALIKSLVGLAGIVDLVPWTREYADILAPLLNHFHVRLHRYHEGSEDEFLSQVVQSIGW